MHVRTTTFTAFLACLFATAVSPIAAARMPTVAVITTDTEPAKSPKIRPKRGTEAGKKRAGETPTKKKPSKKKPPKKRKKRRDKRRRVKAKKTGGPTGKRGGARAKQLAAMTGQRYAKVDQRWTEYKHLTGHWGGGRHWLEERGLLIEPGYSGEFAGIVSGTMPRIASFGGLFDLVAAIKGNPTGLGKTKLLMIGQLAHGDGVTEGGVEDLQVISNIDSPDRVQFAEVWLRQEFAEGQWWLKVGKMDANVDFAALGLAAELIHSSFGVPPNIPLPTFPDPGYGLALAYEPTPSIRYEIGVYEGAPSGLRVVPGNETFAHGWMALAEVTMHTAPLFGRGTGGSIHVGGWARRTSVADKADGQGDARGGWLMFEEPFWTDGDRFAAVFAQLSLRFGDTQGIPTYVGGGVLTQGLLAFRPHDIASIAFAQARLPHWQETAIELLYKVPVIASVNLALDLHVIDRPRGHEGRAIAGLLRVTTQL